jgi:hypothetical protein
MLAWPTRKSQDHHMTERLEDVWVTRDYPVLLEVARRIDRGEDLPTIEAVAESTGLPVDQVSLAAKALHRRGYVHTLESAGGPWGSTTCPVMCTQ